jgi:hypothetical protein
MPWEPERNRNSLSPHGIKEAQGHGDRSRRLRVKSCGDDWKTSAA